MHLEIDHIEMLLIMAGLVALITHKLKLPYTVGLVVAGIGMNYLPVAPGLRMTRDLIFEILLPPLIFEAAIYLPWPAVRRDLGVIGLMATLGVVLAAGVTMVGMVWGLGWSWVAAAAFAALISATDPVSVIACFKENGVEGRLRRLVEAESLFNDGTAAVIFALIVLFAGGQGISAPIVAMEIVTTVGIGLASGLGVAVLMRSLAGRGPNHLIEILFTTVAAYGAFILAERFHGSGVLATLTAGLIIGNTGQFKALLPRGRVALDSFWEYAAFVANSLIFLLIGIQVARQDFAHLWPECLIGIGLVLVGRIVAVYPIAWLFRGTEVRIPPSHQHILFWGGLRGALALALALGLPEHFSMRDDILTVAYAVVAFSVIIQGLSMPWLLKRFGEIKSRLTTEAYGHEK